MSETNPTFQDVQDAFDKELLLEDRDIVRVIAATFLGNQMYFDPIWLMVVASSSGGKTHIINTLSDLELSEGMPHIIPISDVTENTFASGFRRSDKDSSLLNRVPWGGILTFKDFTSILSKRRETKEIIMGQLREIYDGDYVKRTGMGDDITWYGKIGAIAGVTEAVYEYLESLSIMGDRFVMYSMKQPDRKKMLDFVLDKEKSEESSEASYARTKDIFQRYLLNAYKKIDNSPARLDKESETSIKDVANFCTIARSGVIEDYRTGSIKFVPSREMPTRMVKQLLALGSALAFMRSIEHKANPTGDDGEDKLLPHEMNILRKIAFDSIPIKRRIALKYLAQYRQGMHTAGFATRIGYQTDIVKQWLFQLNALGLCTRTKSQGSQGDLWKLKDEYRPIVVKLNNITVVDDILRDEDEDMEEVADEAWSKPEDVAAQNEEAEKLWEQF